MIIIEDEKGSHHEWFTVSEVAKALGLKDINNRPIGRNKFFILLRNEKILMDNNYPYQYYLNLDLVKMHSVVKDFNHTVHIPIFSVRGINYLKNRFNGKVKA